VPLALFVSGVGTFVLIGVAGASVIERYLAIAAVALLVFAGVFLGGFTILQPGRLRTWWTVGAVVLVVVGVVFTATRVRLDYFDSELSFRGAAHDDLARVLESPAVQEGLRCGPLTVPNHKLVPDSRWIHGARGPRRAAAAARRRAGGHQPLRGVQARLEQRDRLAAHPVPAGRLAARGDGRLLRRLCALLAP
jgi:hypothetical protein